MKKHYKYFLISLFFIGCFISTYSQDIIKLKSGEELKVYIQKAGDKEIEYKKTNNPDSPIYSKEMDQVDSVIYHKDLTTIKNQNDNINIVDGSLKLLQEQVKRDSLYLDAIKKQQDQSNNQGQDAMKNIVVLIGNLLVRDSIYQSRLKTQNVEIVKLDSIILVQQENEKKQINQIENSVNNLTNVLNYSSSKDNEDWEPRILGLGVDIGGLIGISSQDKYKPTTIFLTITPIKFLRIETEISATFLSDNPSNYSDNYFAAGMFGMYQSGKTNIYMGFKLIKPETSTTVAISPTIGGEYIIGNHFSLGFEVGIPIAAENNKPNNVTSDIGFNHIIGRFYF